MAPNSIIPPIPGKAPPYSVLFVCLGNICRSPMAHGYFQEHLKTLPPATQALFSTIDSAGTGAYHAGDLSDDRTMDVLERNGITDFRHPSRKVKPTDFDKFDIILGMDTSNYENLVRLSRHLSGPSKPFVGLFGDFNGWRDGAKSNVMPGRGEEVDDPYYGGSKGFNTAYKQMQRFSDGLVAWVEAAAKAHKGNGDDAES